MIVPARSYPAGAVPAALTPDLLAALERAGFGVVPLEADDYVKGSLILESGRERGERHGRVVDGVRVRRP